MDEAKPIKGKRGAKSHRASRAPEEKNEDKPKRKGPTPNRPRSGPGTWKRTSAAKMAEANFIHIDFGEVERLAVLGFSVELIARIMDVSPRTLERRLADNPELKKKLKDGQLNLRTRIRAELIKQATKGNTRILLRMAESLGVLEPQRLNIGGPDGGALEHNHFHTGPGSFEGIAGMVEQLTDLARAKAQPVPEVDMAGDGQSEADTA